MNEKSDGNRGEAISQGEKERKSIKIQETGDRTAIKHREVEQQCREK
jgi:hypothetical protein